MTRILIALLLLPAVLIPVASGAAERGLDRIEITPVQPPENPKPLVKMLDKQPGFSSAAWDAGRGVFTVAVEDSLSLSTRDLRDRLTTNGLEPARIDLYFETVNAEIVDYQGYIFANENGIRLPVLWTMQARRFWGFHGSNPRGMGADFRVQARVFPGAVAENGEAAPDSVDIVHFELTKPAYTGRSK